MGLRLILVGLVASLGFELPTVRDLGRWSELGKTLACSALDGWTMQASDAPAEPAEACPDETNPIPTPVASAQPAQADPAFMAAVEEFVASYEADTVVPALVESAASVAEIAKTVPKEPVQAIATIEPLLVGDDLYEGLAYELNREAEAIRIPDIPAATPVRDPASPEVRASVGDTINARGRRLAHAVHLTGEAVRAWATLLQGPAVVSVQP